MDGSRRWTWRSPDRVLLKSIHRTLSQLQKTISGIAIDIQIFYISRINILRGMRRGVFRVKDEGLFERTAIERYMRTNYFNGMHRYKELNGALRVRY
ncbi:hypothetical protein BABINDRAFT_129477 [Babjeviella inositovora NRRL Y-12698]|uniref:Uncharacterized protein n=1 Tax=Babjeviella inositovora NRRL Y-12698 TaxID=984486 RepID=A0A1E3QR52_9ASCO|nr:uncharacterized protein BABINDRAFT_129477 [Babjeviella inositovora NRRL Y-12698]ODQ80175.1 hypothetical protein BABINDRAFT_129477 [Babjeviella inositovora NRRL Y-12698]